MSVGAVEYVYVAATDGSSRQHDEDENDSMRTRRSRWQKLLLAGLTVIGALALGLVLAVLTGNSSDVDSSITTFDVDSITPVATRVPSVIALTPSTTVSAPTPTALPPATETPAPIDPETTPTLELTEDVFIRETFDEPSPKFPSRETATSSVGTVDQRYQFKLNGQTLIGASLPLPGENYRLSVDIAIVQGGAGIVFLFSEPATWYHIILSPDGAYAIVRQENGVATSVVDWTPSPALQRTPGATNRLQIERRGGLITFFANDELLTEFTVPEGQFNPQFGLVLTSRTGQGEASFDNLLGERLQ